MDKTIFNMSPTNSSSCFSRLIFVIFLSVFFATASFSQDPAPKTEAAKPAADDPEVKQGEALFKEAGCVTCHSIHEKKVGPALKGVSGRWANQATLIAFIRNPQKVIPTDPYANKLWLEYNKNPMPAHEFLTEDQVKSILAYVKVEGAKAPAGPNKDKVVNGEVQPQAKDNSGIILVLIIVVLVLVLISLVLVLVFIRGYLKEKQASIPEDEREVVDQKFEVSKFFRSTGFITFIVLLFIVIATRSCYMGLMSVGVEQNYAPKQPIPFSHKLHAGQYKIDCNYCHTGVNKGKQANIPSINICMNCHSQIKEGPKYGKAGIAMLLDHFEKKRPIEWVRIHNLPDFAYFNHSQHVQVGGVECKTCHGQIDTMEVVSQHSSLTMGWCINCHRETKVNGKDNAYYDKLFAKHKDMTVEQMGGLECSKCHY